MNRPRSQPNLMPIEHPVPQNSATEELPAEAEPGQLDPADRVGSGAQLPDASASADDSSSESESTASGSGTGPGADGRMLWFPSEAGLLAEQGQQHRTLTIPSTDQVEYTHTTTGRTDALCYPDRDRLTGGPPHMPHSQQPWAPQGALGQPRLSSQPITLPRGPPAEAAQPTPLGVSLPTPKDAQLRAQGLYAMGSMGSSASNMSLTAQYAELFEASARAMQSSGLHAGEMPPTDDDDRNRNRPGARKPRDRDRAALAVRREHSGLQQVQLLQAQASAARAAWGGGAPNGTGAALPTAPTLVRHTSEQRLLALDPLSALASGSHAGEVPPDEPRAGSHSRPTPRVPYTQQLSSARSLPGAASVGVPGALEYAGSMARRDGSGSLRAGASFSAPRPPMAARLPSPGPGPPPQAFEPSPKGPDMGRAAGRHEPAIAAPPAPATAGVAHPVSTAQPGGGAEPRNGWGGAAQPNADDDPDRETPEGDYHGHERDTAYGPDGIDRRDERNSSGLYNASAAQEQLDALGLFAGLEDDDDEDRQHDLEKALAKNSKWWQLRYWRIWMIVQAFAIVLFVVGLVLQSQVDNRRDSNYEQFRWFYFLAGLPSIWVIIDIGMHYSFRWIEWWFFRESLLYFKHVQRNAVNFLFLVAILPWYKAMFEWAWCGEERCHADTYLSIVDAQWRIMLCVMLFTLANLVKGIVAKLLSVHFYRSAHFQKLQAALEKEVFLQVLSKPKRKVLKQRQLEEAAMMAAGPVGSQTFAHRLTTSARPTLDHGSLSQKNSAGGDASGGGATPTAAATSAGGLGATTSPIKPATVLHGGLPPVRSASHGSTTHDAGAALMMATSHRPSMPHGGGTLILPPADPHAAVKDSLARTSARIMDRSFAVRAAQGLHPGAVEVSAFPDLGPSGGLPLSRSAPDMAACSGPGGRASSQPPVVSSASAHPVNASGAPPRPPSARSASQLQRPDSGRGSGPSSPRSTAPAARLSLTGLVGRGGAGPVAEGTTPHEEVTDTDASSHPEGDAPQPGQHTITVHPAVSDPVLPTIDEAATTAGNVAPAAGSEHPGKLHKIKSLPRGGTGHGGAASDVSPHRRRGTGGGGMAGSTTSDRARRAAAYAQPLGPLAQDIISAVPLQTAAKKDITQMTEAELEKVRTAVVIKTYTAIIRNYAAQSPEDAEREHAAIRTFSRALFANIRADADSRYITIDDFLLFFDNPDHAVRAFCVFDVDGDGTVTRKEVRDAVEAIHQERANMADSLRDTDAIVRSLEWAVGALVHFLFLALYLLIWRVNIVEGFSTFSATLLAFTFVFGNAVKNAFEAMLFLFAEHPFDVGDNVSIAGDIYRIKKITLLFTEMVAINGERVFYPNAELMNLVLVNCTRTKTKTEYIRIAVDVGVRPEVLADIMAALRQLADANPTEYDGMPFVQFREMADPMKVVIMVSWTYSFAPDNWKRLVPARNAMYGILQAKLYEHRLRYTTSEIEHKSVKTPVPIMQ